MSNNKSRLSTWLPLVLVALVGMSLGIISCNESKAGNDEKEVKKTTATKVLYVTHEPGRFHAYTPQKKIFLEIAAEHKWDVTVLSGTHKEVIKKLSSTTDFADGYDVVVYNFCFAGCADLNVPYNIITQTKEKGIPAMLIHCSLHSFWPTYKERGAKSVHAPGAHEKARTRKNLLDQWNKDHPDKPFPSWQTFTGIASGAHGPKVPIQIKKIDGEHAIVKEVPEYETVKQAELYNNIITADDSKSTKVILKGVQRKATHVVLWEHPVGKSKVVSFTLGHSVEEWGQKEFQSIIGNTVKYLAGLPKEKPVIK